MKAAITRNSASRTALWRPTRRSERNVSPWNGGPKTKPFGTTSMPSRGRKAWRRLGTRYRVACKKASPGNRWKPCVGPHGLRSVGLAEQRLIVRLVPVKQRMLHVRPEFFHHLREGVRRAGNPQPLDIVGRRAGVRIIGIRDGHRRSVSQPFGEIKPPSAAVCAGDEDAGCRISRTVQDAAAAAADPEVARVFVQQGGEEALRHHVADNLVA